MFKCSIRSSFLFTLTDSSVLLFCSVRSRKSSEERYGESLCPHTLRSQYVRSASIRWPADEPAWYATASSTQRSRRHAAPQWLWSRIRRRQLRWHSILFLIGRQLPSHFFCSSQNPSVAVIGISQLTDNMTFIMTSALPLIFFEGLVWTCLVVLSQWDRAHRCLCCMTKTEEETTVSKWQFCLN